MSHLDASQDAGPLPVCALEELQDYLTIFEGEIRPGLRFTLGADGLEVIVDGVRLGIWRREGDALVFDGTPYALVHSLQAAVLQTLSVVGAFVPEPAAATG